MPADAERGSVQCGATTNSYIVVDCQCGVYTQSREPTFYDQGRFEQFAREIIDTGWSIEPPQCPDCNTSTDHRHRSESTLDGETLDA